MGWNSKRGLRLPLRHFLHLPMEVPGGWQIGLSIYLVKNHWNPEILSQSQDSVSEISVWLDSPSRLAAIGFFCWYPGMPPTVPPHVTPGELAHTEDDYFSSSSITASPGALHLWHRPFQPHLLPSLHAYSAFPTSVPLHLLFLSARKLLVLLYPSWIIASLKKPVLTTSCPYQFAIPMRSQISSFLRLSEGVLWGLHE